MLSYGAPLRKKRQSSAVIYLVLRWPLAEEALKSALLHDIVTFW
jgi:hypothetical protein